MKDHLQDPHDRLTSLIREGDQKKLQELIDSLSRTELIHLLSLLDADTRLSLMRTISPEYGAYLLEEVPNIQAPSLIERLSVEEAAGIVHELPSDEKADLLGELKKEEADAILKELEPIEARATRKLIDYDSDEAGGLMATEFIAFPLQIQVRDVISELQLNAEKYSDYQLQYLYVTTSRRKLLGVLRLRDLIMAPPQTRLASIMIKEIVFVQDHTPFEELVDFFDEYNLIGAPVVNEQGQMLGVVLRKHVLERATLKSEQDLMRSQGIVSGEEFRSMPTLLRSRRRLSWLSLNIVLNLMAASVIAFYEDTLSSMIALAVFLPIISDMSGCSGNQAVAVSMRELALGVVKPSEVFRVWWKESALGLINGITLGIMLALVAYLWKGSIYLSLVVGSALAFNTLFSVTLGGTVPLLLKRFDIDPALASGPILTTLTDLVGFFLTLSFASMALSRMI